MAPMKKENIEKIIQNLDKTISLSQRIDSNIIKINKYIQESPLSIIESFKIYTEPQKNIEALIKFYKLFLEVIRNNESHLKNLQHLNFYEGELKAIHSFYEIRNELDKLNGYNDIKVVKRYIDKIKEKSNITQPIFNSFFKYFGKDVTDKDLHPFSKFLEVYDEKPFIAKYCKVLFFKFSKKNEKDPEKILENIKNINNMFKEIETYNKKYLNEKNSEIVGQQIKQMVMIEMRDNLSSSLLVFENKFQFINLVLACDFFIQLQNKELQGKFSEFDDGILKVINNLFIKFIQKVNSIKEPNGLYEVEEFIYHLYRVIKLFEHKELHKMFFLYPDFKNNSQMKAYLGNLCIEKIFDLAVSLKGIQKNVYLLNNLHLIQFFYREYKGKKTIEYIEEKIDEIVKTWEVECDNKKGKDPTRFLDVNLDIQGKYYLPEDIKEILIREITKIVEKLTKQNRYRNGEQTLNLKLKKLFSGK